MEKKRRYYIIEIVFWTVVCCSVDLFITYGTIREEQSSKKREEPLSFQIVDTSKDCPEGLEEIARDEEWIYYLPCQKSENIYIEFSNGERYRLREALEKEKVTIEELLKKELVLEKVPISTEPDTTQNSNTNSNTNKEPSKPSTNSSTNQEKPSSNQEFSIASDTTLLLTEQEIESYNQKIRSRTNQAYDVERTTSLSKKQILDYMNDYTLPKLPQYRGKTAITNKDLDTILENQNREKVTDQKSLQRGIVVKRTNLKSFPTSLHFFDEKGATDFDNLQESELHVNTPLLILHESKDHEWYFVMTPFYVGWVLKQDIAIATDEDYRYFQKNDSFVVILEPKIKVGDTLLDMSVQLPYVGTQSGNYRVILPVKLANGQVGKKEVSIAQSSAHVGYLPYTKQNVYQQAMKYQGTPYHWGGMDEGVDCSSYVANVYRTFGIQFPRNTSSQKSSVGTITSLKEKTTKEKLSLLKGKEPCLLYQDGHVMLYLGMKNNRHYMIHASGTEMKVVVTELTTSSSYLKKID